MRILSQVLKNARDSKLPDHEKYLYDNNAYLKSVFNNYVGSVLSGAEFHSVVLRECDQIQIYTDIQTILLKIIFLAFICPTLHTFFFLKSNCMYRRQLQFYYRYRYSNVCYNNIIHFKLFYASYLCAKSDGIARGRNFGFCDIESINGKETTLASYEAEKKTNFQRLITYNN